MEYSSFLLTSLLILVVVVLSVANGQPLVPALFIFGDSVLDVGNNNHLDTIIKANFPPYGRDFKKHKPTGRFSNGKLASDFTAETLGFTSYQPAYLNTKGKARNILHGVNFASAASGYYESTAQLYHAISLSQQLKHYKECQQKLTKLTGQSNASSIISDAIYLISAGNSDFIQNYYINPMLNKVHTVEQFSDILMESYSNFVQKLYFLGARRIGVTTLPPMGCLPATITIFGYDSGSNECIDRLNKDALNFNKKLNTTSQNLKKSLSGLNLVVLDIYHPLYDLVTKPSDRGFFEGRKACCGTGLAETAILCNTKSQGTCANASGYVFWDGFHPSEAANRVLADELLLAGISLIS